MEEKLEFFKRANFFPGLQVGPAYWNAVEDYHFNKELLYNKLVHDTVKRWIGGSMQFHLRNVIRGRKTLIIRRTDIYNGNYSVEVSMDGTESRMLDVDGVDTKQRWRNLFVIYEEGEIKDNTGIVKFSIGEKGRDNSGSIWVYQML